MSDQPREDCFLCQAQSANAEVPWYDTPLIQNESGIVMPALGALRPGYLLIAPRRHASGVAALSPDDRITLADLVQKAQDLLLQEFPAGVVFEHGDRVPGHPRSSCVEHAHLHLWAVDCRFQIPGPIVYYESVAHYVNHADGVPFDHYVMGGALGERLVVGTAPPTSQFLRRQIAAALGRPDDWDYAQHPELANVALTIDLLATKNV